MDTNLDTRLHDDVALAEIDLYTDVLVAAATAVGRISPEELDRVLGLPPSVAPVPPAPRAPHTVRRRVRMPRR
ncbi:hypothetical protein [Nocardiopsis ansamitocini]|uniref:hypothetical protein n=1 Tax=Nocardiopsis ansamitocini TaxID=1670832 RepID=UPI0025538945|nr:hypothetical protein [Nocardiopsis ansamitocini]